MSLNSITVVDIKLFNKKKKKSRVSLPVQLLVQHRRPTYRSRGVLFADALALVQEPQASGFLASTLAEGVENLLQLRRLLNLKVNIGRRVGNLDVDVFGFGLDFGLGGGLGHGKEYRVAWYVCRRWQRRGKRKEGKEKEKFVDCAVLLPICSLVVVVVLLATKTPVPNLVLYSTTTGLASHCYCSIIGHASVYIRTSLCLHGLGFMPAVLVSNAIPLLLLHKQTREQDQHRHLEDH